MFLLDTFGMYELWELEEPEVIVDEHEEGEELVVERTHILKHPQEEEISILISEDGEVDDDGEPIARMLFAFAVEMDGEEIFIPADTEEEELSNELFEFIVNAIDDSRWEGE
jgi:hypothetical protein